MPYYRDLREHIKALENRDKLIRVTREINKDTELHPLVRWQFRGLPETERKAFLFENVVDAKGTRYPSPVLVASHAASREVYAISMGCPPLNVRRGDRGEIQVRSEPIPFQNYPVRPERRARIPHPVQIRLDAGEQA